MRDSIAKTNKSKDLLYPYFHVENVDKCAEMVPEVYKSVERMERGGIRGVFHIEFSKSQQP